MLDTKDFTDIISINLDNNFKKQVQCSSLFFRSWNPGTIFHKWTCWDLNLGSLIQSMGSVAPWVPIHLLSPQFTVGSWKPASILSFWTQLMLRDAWEINVQTDSQLALPLTRSGSQSSVQTSPNLNRVIRMLPFGWLLGSLLFSEEIISEVHLKSKLWLLD